MRFPTRSWKEQYLAISVAVGKNFEVDGLFYTGGIEVLPTDFVALRIGYMGGPNDLEFPSYGVGLLLNGWKLDFGTTPGKIAGELFQVTVSAPIWNQLDEIY